MNKKNLLEINHATVYRSQQKVLEDFSLSISPGEHTAVVGPNGSGKSTLVQLLTKELYPLANDNNRPVVQLFGQENWNVSELRKRMGIVSMQLHNEIMHNLNNGATRGKDVVVSGLFSSMQLFKHQKITGEMRKRAMAALEKMGGGYLAEKKYNQMSSGEARRVLIARALILEPELLVLDEPTTALDAVARERCLHYLRSVVQNNVTIILVTHHLEEIIPEIDQTLLLKKGEVAFHGPKSQTLRSSHLQKVFDHPVTVHHTDGRYRLEPSADF